VLSGVAITVWNGGFVMDSFALFIAILACVTALFTCLLTDSVVRTIPSRSGTFYALILVATAAVEAIGAEREMTTLFVSLAVLLICLVALGSLVKTNPRGAVSSFEHLIEGSVGLAVVLYGLALLYGITRSTDLSALAGYTPSAPGAIAIAVTLIVLGLCGTLGVFPLRQWVGRVATNVPAGAAAFIVSMSLIAGGAALARVTVAGLGPDTSIWRWLLPIVAAVALGHAAFSALRETTVSRLIGQLVSAQAAMLLLGLLAFSNGSQGLPAFGVTAFLSGLGITAIATVAAFGVLSMLQVAGIGDTIDNVRGLGHRSAPSALLLTVAIASLGGVPPLAGFLSRVLLISSAADTHYGWLAVVAVGASLLTVIATVRFVAALYSDAGDEVPFTLGATPVLSRIVAGAACLAGVVLVVLIQPLLAVATAGAGTLR
jgi:NADH-quinone oxidoreductase subunit N